MLLADVAHRNPFSSTIGDGDTEQPLGFKYTLCVMPEGSVSEMAVAFLGLVKPLMYRQIILWNTAKFSGAGFCELVAGAAASQ